jgi:uncharacterized protein
MGFEYDKQKSQINKVKHQIDFIEAQQLWLDPFRIIIPSQFVFEKRLFLIAAFKNKIWSAIFTYRDENIRIISVRKSRKNEKEIYYSQRI